MWISIGDTKLVLIRGFAASNGKGGTPSAYNRLLTIWERWVIHSALVSGVDATGPQGEQLIDCYLKMDTEQMIENCR